MRQEHDDREAPRWLKLAATLRSEPAPDTLARVRARLAAREATPGWLLWLARPVTVAASAALLVATAWAAVVLLPPAANESGEAVSLTSALLGDDGSMGLAPAEVAGESGADTGEVAP